MRYTVRQSWPLSGTRSSWHRRPIDGIGRECGKLRFSPCCSLPSRYPASILASSEKGGVLIWPCSQTRGFSPGAIGTTTYVKYDISARGCYAEAGCGLRGVRQRRRGRGKRVAPRGFEPRLPNPERRPQGNTNRQIDREWRPDEHRRPVGLSSMSAHVRRNACKMLAESSGRLS